MNVFFVSLLAVQLSLFSQFKSVNGEDCKKQSDQLNDAFAKAPSMRTHLQQLTEKDKTVTDIDNVHKLEFCGGMPKSIKSDKNEFAEVTKSADGNSNSGAVILQFKCASDDKKSAYVFVVCAREEKQTEITLSHVKSNDKGSCGDGMTFLLTLPCENKATTTAKPAATTTPAKPTEKPAETTTKASASKSTNDGSKQKDDDDSSSTGHGFFATFFLLLFLGIALYLGIGVGYNRFVMHARGPEQIPNYLFWVRVGRAIQSILSTDRRSPNRGQSGGGGGQYQRPTATRSADVPLATGDNNGFQYMQPSLTVPSTGGQHQQQDRLLDLGGGQGGQQRGTNRSSQQMSQQRPPPAMGGSDTEDEKLLPL